MSKKIKLEARCLSCNAYLSKYNTHNNGMCSPCTQLANLSPYNQTELDRKGKPKLTKVQKEDQLIQLAKRLGGRI